MCENDHFYGGWMILTPFPVQIHWKALVLCEKTTLRFICIFEVELIFIGFQKYVKDFGLKRAAIQLSWIHWKTWFYT